MVIIISYNKQTWNEYNDSQTADKNLANGAIISADRLNHMETGISNNDINKVTDNKDGTEQLNGVKVQPYNKLSDTIGGRNLLINTAQLNDSTGCFNQKSNISDTYLGLNIYQTNTQWDGVSINWPYLAPKIRTNKNYVMSEYVRNTSPTTSADIGIYGDDTGVRFNSRINYSFTTLPPNSGWTRISAPVNIASFPTNISSGVGLRFDNATTLTDGCVQFAGLKFEQGSVATDWSPDPEDKVTDNKDGTIEVNGNSITPVHDNKNGTEQLNGVQVQPFNKLSDTIGGRNMATNLGDVLVTPVGSLGWSSTTIGTVTPEFFKVINQKTTQPITISFEINTPDDPTKTNLFDRIQLDGFSVGNDNAIGTDYFNVLGFKWLEIGNNVWKGTYSLQFNQGSDVEHSDKLNINLVQSGKNKTPSNFTVLGNSLCLYWGTQAIDWTPAPEDKADDSKVAHLSGANNFDTVPTYGTNNKPFAINDTGATTARPTGQAAGYQYFDKTLNKPIWYNGSKWVDSTGKTV